MHARRARSATPRSRSAGVWPRCTPHSLRSLSWPRGSRTRVPLSAACAWLATRLSATHLDTDALAGGDASAASDSALHCRSQRSGKGACGDLICGGSLCGLDVFLALLVHAADSRELLFLGRGARGQGLLQEEEQVDVTPAGECASAGDGPGAGCIGGIHQPKIRFAAHASARGPVPTCRSTSCC